jgi:hypothetical protein
MSVGASLFRLARSEAILVVVVGDVLAALTSS